MTQPAPQRLGVFGGAFDPPHRAHQALAQAAVQQLQLDQLRIVPTGQAWHKSRSLSAPAHRLAMARLAFADLPGACIDPRELSRSGPSYTVDTLAELHAEYPQAQLFLLMGDDQAQALTTWHRWQDLPRLATICVAARGYSTGSGGQFGPNFPSMASLQLLKMPPLDLSATTIRERLACGQDIGTLVSEPVARYIADHHLYQTT